MNLDVGCGEWKPEGFIGMDIRPLPQVDVVHDLHDTPWPFDKQRFRVVRMHHILEHVKPWRIMDVMDEAHRVLSRYGHARIEIPVAGSESLNQDPTHVRGWVEKSVEYFDPDYSLYTVFRPAPWKVMRNDRVGDMLKITLEKRWTETPQ